MGVSVQCAFFTANFADRGIPDFIYGLYFVHQYERVPLVQL